MGTSFEEIIIFLVDMFQRCLFDKIKFWNTMERKNYF